ncbi:hypothetical protein LZ30DRAFT_801904 [Colletotrichum cereale]|nr:hypothetical protein LZ30DRAFT_801904 [Colletotrichum cereale]
MSPTQKLLAFLLAANLGWHAEAGASHVPNGHGQAAIQVRQDNSSRTSIDDALKHPNATGTWPINGIDLTKPLVNPPTDDSGPGNGWSIDIAVATNISKVFGSRPSVANPVRITLEGPGTVLEDASTTASVYDHYEVCSFTWYSNSWTVEELEKLQQDADGSCNGVVSEECVQGIRKGLAGKPCGQPSPSNIPDSCPSLIGPASSSGGRAFAFQRSVTNLFGSWGPYANTSEADVRDVYDEAVTNVYPMLLTFNYDNGETRSNYSVFRCVRANNIAEGSRQPYGFGSRRKRKSSGARVSGTALAAVMGLLFSLSVASFL